MNDLDIYYMDIAIKEAKKSYTLNEIPIGAIIVDANGQVIAQSHNKKEHLQIATKHAEIEVIEQACLIRNSWRLNDCTLYVTLEPCLMCTGAIIQAHVGRVVIGAKAHKQRGFEDIFEAFPKPAFNHYPETTYGVSEKVCATLLSDFFSSVRKER